MASHRLTKRKSICDSVHRSGRLIDEAHAPVPHQELVGLVSKIAELVTHRDVVHRFNATHPITADKEGVSTFMLEILLRARGVEDLAALQIIGMQIRREGLRRGGLANEVQRLLQACEGSPSMILHTKATLRHSFRLICGALACCRFLSFRSLGRGFRPGEMCSIAHRPTLLSAGCQPGVVS